MNGPGDARVVTLLTDFGTRDSYVAEMKGEMLRITPDLRFVDVTHDVRPGDIAEARYLFSRTWPRFPRGTVHLVIVDPGVGTDRAALAAVRDGHAFVGPDNGVLGPVLPAAHVIRLEVPRSASPTFHARDVFAPAAARLARGMGLTELGSPFKDWTPGDVPRPTPMARGLAGIVVHVDRFGTLVTNLPGAVLEGRESITVARGRIPVGRTFADVAPGSPVAFHGSNGTVEIAVRDGSAAAVLGAGLGTEVSVGEP